MADDDAGRKIAAIAALVRSFEIKISRAFLEAVRNLKSKLDLDRLISLLQEGRVSEAIGLVKAEEATASLAPLGNLLSTSIIRAGEVEAQDIERRLAHISVVFGVTNPANVEFLRSYEMTRVRQLTADVLAAVKQAVMDGVQVGLNPRGIAQDIVGSIGLTDKQVQTVSNYRRLLENKDRQALQRQLRDRRSDASVERAASGGRPLTAEQIDGMVDRYRQRFIRYRAVTIARTEAQTAANAGTWLAWKQAAAEGKFSANQVRRDWSYVHDNRVRHAHMTIPSLNPEGVGLDQPFMSELGPIMYPGDPNVVVANRVNCRCAQLIRFVEA